MKKILFLIILFLTGIQYLRSETVPSSCAAPDSIHALYFGDAERLVHRKIFRQGLSYKDSIIIPQVHLDTVMNALLAVYNAVSLFERDTIISILPVHSFRPMLNSIIIDADTNLIWMKNLRIDVFPTGNTYIDSLISVYKFKVTNKDFWEYFFVLESEKNYNVNPIISALKKLEGVYIAESNGYRGDGEEITDSVYTDFVELVYSYGWGDCQSGCAYRRYWKFRVYHDCSVEFVESFGNTLDITNISLKFDEKISVFPNPFINTIFISGINQEFDYTITNLLGQKIISGKSSDFINIDYSIKLNEKIYFLKIQVADEILNFKLFSV